MDQHGDDPPSPRRGEATSASAPTTVEAEVRARLAEGIGGPRGAVEAALPIIVFTVAFTLTEEVRPAVVAALAVALALFGVRVMQRASTQFVRNGLVGIVIAAAIATFTGRAEAAFLPGIVQNAVGAMALGASLLARRPIAGYVIGSVLGDPSGWRNDPAIMRLSNRLTGILLVPMLVRPAVQYPLYLAGEVGWLGLTRVALGWPLSLAAVAVAGAILARGRTPMRSRPGPGPDPQGPQ